jgi:membrane protease YdiL (CAAX protease family)
MSIALTPKLFYTFNMRKTPAWIAARLELSVLFLALPTFFSMVSMLQGEVQPWQSALVYGLALVYGGLTLWSPMQLPGKEPLPVDRPIARRTALRLSAVVLVGVALLILSSLITQGSGGGKTRLPYFVLAIILIISLGTGGALAERGLTIDLLPVLRRRQPRRIVYVLVAAFFLAMLTFFWSNLFSGVIDSIGRAASEAAPDVQSAASSFSVENPLLLFVQLFIGAGLYEELLFRLGIMTIVWRLTHRWGWGLIVSAVFFGLYHISPLSGISTYNAASPLTAVLTSFSMGIIMGIIYRYRGLETVVLVHGLGDWLVLMLLASSAA